MITTYVINLRPSAPQFEELALMITRDIGSLN